ncbi:hypothetical protein RB595_004805 [Gaeumannomyces hyphopodioides]
MIQTLFTPSTSTAMESSTRPTYSSSRAAPASSLTYPYVFPTECSTVTDVWIPSSMESQCQPLTGTYYSPAICPNDWTAAFTLPSGGNGPPVEPEETAMLCCPSSMTSLSVVCGTSCVSASMISGTSGLSVHLAMVRNPIQIRWAPSDLSVLETHPLTPGLRIAPTATITTIASPTGPYKAGIGLALAPLLIACLAAVWGSILRFRKRRQNVAGDQPTASRPFRPRVFLLLSQSVLIAFVISAITLLEISCRTLPVKSFDLTALRSNVTKSHVLEAVLEVRTAYVATTKPPIDLTCRQVSTTSEWNPTTICSSSGTAVAIPSCVRGPGPPPGSKWLSAASQGDSSKIAREGPVEGAFFVASVLPPLGVVLFALPWKTMAVQAASLEPFHQMTRPAGASLFASYSGLGARAALVPAMTTIPAGAASLLTALSAEAWGLGLAGDCMPGDNRGCVPFVQAVPSVVRAMQGVLGLMCVFAGVLVFATRQWSAGTAADPRSLLGLATLAQSRRLQAVVGSVDPGLSVRDTRAQLGLLRIRLGSVEPADSLMGRQDSGMLLPENAVPSRENLAAGHSLDGTARTRKTPIPRVCQLVIFLLVMLAALETVVVYYITTEGDTGFERFKSGQQFGPRFLFALCGILINLAMVAVLNAVLPLVPFYSLASERGAAAASSILSPYAADHYTALFRFPRGSLMIATAALPAILSDFLPLLLANIPFQRTTTWGAHLVCSWAAIGMLAIMMALLVVLLGFLIFTRPRPYINVQLLAEAPIVSLMEVLCKSTTVVARFGGLSTLHTRDRDRQVLRFQGKYFVVSESGNRAVISFVVS